MDKFAYTLGVTGLLFAVVFITRALPFLFARQMRDNALFQYLGSHLPSCIIFLLVVYYVIAMAKPTHWTTLPWHLLSLVVTLTCHWLWRNMLLSLAVGTVTFLLLNTVTA